MGNETFSWDGLTLYKSLVQPYLLYGLNSWGQANRTNLSKYYFYKRKLFRRLIHFTNERDSTLTFFLKSNILPITFSYYESIAHLMYDVAHQNTPANICNVFTFVSNVHSYTVALDHQLQKTNTLSFHEQTYMYKKILCPESVSVCGTKFQKI